VSIQTNSRKLDSQRWEPHLVGRAKRTCAHWDCHETFTPKRDDHIFCCPEHRFSYHYEANREARIEYQRAWRAARKNNVESVKRPVERKSKRASAQESIEELKGLVLELRDQNDYQAYIIEQQAIERQEDKQIYEARIDHLQDMLMGAVLTIQEMAAKQPTVTNAPVEKLPGGPKQIAAAATLKLPPPLFDDDMLDLLDVKKDESAGSRSSENLRNTLMAMYNGEGAWAAEKKEAPKEGQGTRSK
jgi:hypothetical protein